MRNQKNGRKGKGITDKRKGKRTRLGYRKTGVGMERYEAAVNSS